jgi:hypothetical protein
VSLSSFEPTFFYCCIVDMLNVALFETRDIDLFTRGAGIVPIARNLNGEMYALLGREQHVDCWRGSGKWSGFEGGRKGNESVESCASREWREESLSLYNISSESLRQSEFTRKLVLSVIRGEKAQYCCRGPQRFHVTYIIEVPFNAFAPREFANKRDKLLALKLRMEAFRGAVESISGLSAPILNDLVMSSDSAVFEFSSGMRLSYVAPFDACVDVCARKHSAMLDAGREVSVKGAVMHRSNPKGDVIDLSINEDYFEKDAVRWWSMSELREILHSGGRCKDEMCRVFFLPVIEALIEIDDSETRSRVASNL